MLKIVERTLTVGTRDTLADFQRQVDSIPTYSEQVGGAADLWAARTNTARGSAAFRNVRAVLATMCVGAVRCGYCEDSLADEVEHIYPKSVFPNLTFVWQNYLFACGPCNGPKGNRHAIVRRGRIVEYERRRGAPVDPPPAGTPALLDPRHEDPTEFLELDVGGTSADGLVLRPTFDYLVREGLSPEAQLRTEYTIRVLGLNREVLRVARGNAFGGFRARLLEYARAKMRGDGEARLSELRDDLLRTPHLTVFFEMRRQAAWLPAVRDALDIAPEVHLWALIPPDA